MTAEEFEHLDESEKKILLFEARKLAQRLDDSSKSELFQIEDFYVESTICRSMQARRKLKIYQPSQVNEIFPFYENFLMG